MTTRQAPDPAERLAAETRTLEAAWRLFRRQRSVRVIATGLTATTGVRVVSGFGGIGWSWWDLAALGIVVALVPFVEWFVHLVVLHARPRKIGRWSLDTGFGHREHHLNPASVGWLLLRGREAALFQVMNGLTVAAVVGGPLWLIGAPVLGPILTGVVASVAALAHYEWAHFLFHIAYRPRTRFYRRLKANHRLHHWRNERYWLGVTSNLGDRAMRTYPSSKSDVALSPTARTLGFDPEPATE